MEWITAAEAAQRWGITARRVQVFCSQGRISGAEKVRGSWRIPEGTIKPDDPRGGGRSMSSQQLHLNRSARTLAAPISCRS